MKKSGVTLVEILIIVSIIGVLLAIAMPNFMSSVGNVHTDTCIINLRQINLAKEQWALENDIEVGDDGDEPAAADLDSYIKDGTAGLVCPLDSSSTFATSYTINSLGTNPVCKISAGDHHL